MSGRLTGKVVLITGGASGIGLASAEACAREGASVVITDINAAEGAAQAQRLSADGLAVSFQRQDVTSEDDWRRVIDETLQQHGRLDVLVNNAGIAVIAPLEQETLEGWRRTQAINVEGVFLGSREAVRVMKERGGSIINLSSIEGLIGEPLVPAYNASKGAVRIFTKSTALHCAQQGYGIRVNSDPPRLRRHAADGERARLTAARAGGGAASGPDAAHSTRAAAVPQEIAHGVVFLASDESSYMTGSELVIDGGYTAK